MFKSVLLNVCDNGVLLALCGFSREYIEAQEIELIMYKKAHNVCDFV